MPPFAVREPFSTLTHALGLAAALPTTWLLVRAALRRREAAAASRSFETGKVVALLVFGLGMAACYGTSTVYHAWPEDGPTLALLLRLDLVGIFLLIAGTFTPAAWALMRPRPRRIAMVAVWGVSAVCGSAILLGRPFAAWLTTSIYLALGWGMLLCYADVRRDYSGRTLRLLPIGGALYSAGAVVNLTRAEFAPGFNAHDLFHLFVLAGTAAHVAFLARVVVPAPEPKARGTDRPATLARRRRRRDARVDA